MAFGPSCNQDAGLSGKVHDVGDHQRHDEHDHDGVESGYRPTPAVVRQPETPDSQHVEDEGDDADGQPDHRPGTGKCSDRWRQDRQDYIAEQTPKTGKNDRSAEYSVCGGLVGRRRTLTNAKKTAHREVCG